jgi:hypothetical protein
LYYIIRAENNICARKRGRDKDFITCQQKLFLMVSAKKRGKKVVTKKKREEGC